MAVTDTEGTAGLYRDLPRKKLLSYYIPIVYTWNIFLLNFSYMDTHCCLAEKDKAHWNARSLLLRRAVIQFAGCDSLWLYNLSEPRARSEAALIMSQCRGLVDRLAASRIHCGRDITLWHPPRDCSSLHHTLLMAFPSLCWRQQMCKAVLVWLVTVLILLEGLIREEIRRKVHLQDLDEVQFLVGVRAEIYSGFLLSWISPISESAGYVWVILLLMVVTILYLKTPGKF